MVAEKTASNFLPFLSIFSSIELDFEVKQVICSPGESQSPDWKHGRRCTGVHIRGSNRGFSQVCHSKGIQLNGNLPVLQRLSEDKVRQNIRDVGSGFHGGYLKLAFGVVFFTPHQQLCQAEE